MSLVALGGNGKQDAARGDRSALVNRVLSSRHFEKSARLRDFLSYVAERALAEPGVRLHEQEIAESVFLRPAQAAKGEDTTVRVHAYQLRKRLEGYFATEGAHEPVIIEIPKGNYAPAFRPRHLPEAQGPVASEAVHPVRKPRTLYLVAASVIAVLVVSVAAWLGVRGRAAHVPRAAEPSALNSFWAQFAHKDRRTDVVLADSGASLFADIVHRPPTLAEYLNRDYWKEAEKLPHPELREAARMIRSRQHTSIGDANLAFRIAALSGHDKGKTTLYFARDFHIRHLKTDDVVLLGSARSNPWTELFESQLNFRFTYDEALREATIVNTSPAPGEALSYRVRGARKELQEGYCRIAFLGNTGRTGSVLLIAGTEMEGTEAGGEFLTSEPAMRQLRGLLRLKPYEPFPWFEVLLRTTRIGGAAPRFEIVTVRRPPGSST